MIWSEKIKQLFIGYGFTFNDLPPTKDELMQLSPENLKRYRDLKNMIDTAFNDGIEKAKYINGSLTGLNKDEIESL